MKKFFLPVLALFSLVIVSSCGASKHRCPAYGSNDEIKQQPIDQESDLYFNTEQKG